MTMLAECILLCGDIAVNPGPINFSEIQRRRGLRLCHWNIQRLTDTKFEEISLALNTSEQSPEQKLDIFILTETFCTSKVPDKYYDIKGYNLYKKDRLDKKGGGILVYANENVKTKRRTDLEAEHIEVLWLEVYPHKSKRPILMSGFYRPPSANKEYNINLEKNIEDAFLLNLEMNVMGDINYDFLDTTTCYKQDLIKTLGTCNLKQIVGEITRPVSGTCLDHIYTTHPERMYNCTTMNVGLSDHLPVLAVRRYKRPQGEPCSNGEKHQSFEYRNLKKMDKEAFIRDLNDAPWDAAFVFDDVDDIVDAWYDIFNTILDKHAPVITKRIRRNSQPKWFTEDLNKEIQTRDYLLKKARCTNSPEAWKNYKETKNKVTRLIRTQKKTFFRSQVNENQRNPKKLWSLIKNLSRESSTSNIHVQQLEDNGVITTDPNNIANILNSFFADICLNPTDEGDNISFSMDGKVDIENSFELPLITLDKVLKILQEMPANKATGADKCGPMVLKIAAPGIASVLVRLINHCIQNSKFPLRWKTAKVIPVYKKHGEKSDKHNYRPISVLPILSKIYERHIYDSLYTYLTVNNLLYGFQSGFRSSHSTESALIRLIDQLLFELDQDKVSGLLCVDYSKAFDLINHDILIAKLKIFGIDGKDLQLFRSYFTDRRQYVSVKEGRSSMREIKHGSPKEVF